MEKAKKKTKITDAVKKKLESYEILLKKIKNQKQRLNTFKASMGSASTSNFTGVPGGSGNGESKIERQYLKKEELEYKIKKLEREEVELLDELEALIEQLQDPDEQTVIEMRYIDCISWRPISQAIYGDMPDYEENAEKYLKKSFKVHGSALLVLAKVYQPEKMEA